MGRFVLPAMLLALHVSRILEFLYLHCGLVPSCDPEFVTKMQVELAKNETVGQEHHG